MDEQQHARDGATPGILMAVVGPSGVGKSSLCDRLLDEFSPTLGLSISYTTRAPRAGEQEGEDYFYVTHERFEAMIADGAFVEHAHVHGNLYGTTAAAVRAALSSGQDLLFDIDYQGAQQLKAAFPGTVGLMIAPPDLLTLEERLRGRKTDDEETIQRRLAVARKELAQALSGVFSYVVTNDDFDRAYGDLRAIYRTQSLQVGRQEVFLREVLSIGREHM